MINLIVLALLDYIINKIDKGTVTSTESRYNEIGKHEHTINKKKNYYSIGNTFDNEVKIYKIQPCKICKKLNKGKK